MRDMTLTIGVPNDSRVLSSHIEALVKVIRQANGDKNSIKHRVTRLPEAENGGYEVSISCAYADYQPQNTLEIEAIGLKHTIRIALVECFEWIRTTPIHYHGDLVMFTLLCKLKPVKDNFVA